MSVDVDWNECDRVDRGYYNGDCVGEIIETRDSETIEE